MDRRCVTLLHSFYPPVFWWGLWSQWEEMPTELQCLEDAQHRPCVVLGGYNGNLTHKQKKKPNQTEHPQRCIPSMGNSPHRSSLRQKKRGGDWNSNGMDENGGGSSLPPLLVAPLPTPQRSLLSPRHSQMERGSRNRRGANKFAVSWVDWVERHSWHGANLYFLARWAPANPYLWG